MADALFWDFQPAVPKDDTCGKYHPPNCEPHGGGNGAVTEPSRMRALKTVRHPDHGDPEELVRNKRTRDGNTRTGVDAAEGPPEVKTHALFGNERTRVDTWETLPDT